MTDRSVEVIGAMNITDVDFSFEQDMMSMRATTFVGDVFSALDFGDFGSSLQFEHGSGFVFPHADQVSDVAMREGGLMPLQQDTDGPTQSHGDAYPVQTLPDGKTVEQQTEMKSPEFENMEFRYTLTTRGQ